MTNTDFIKSITAARSDATASGILASITIAQEYLESAYGTSEMAVNDCNLFGMTSAAPTAKKPRSRIQAAMNL